MLVVMEGSDEITSPLRDQVILKGSSPLRTKQANWAESPSFTESVPKENGTMTGGSENQQYNMLKCLPKNDLFENFHLPISKNLTVDFKLCSS